MFKRHSRPWSQRFIEGKIEEVLHNLNQAMTQDMEVQEGWTIQVA